MYKWGGDDISGPDLHLWLLFNKAEVHVKVFFHSTLGHLLYALSSLPTCGGPRLTPAFDYKLQVVFHFQRNPALLSSSSQSHSEGHAPSEKKGLNRPRGHINAVYFEPSASVCHL